jgi:phospholipase/carboxylesterase
MTLPAGPLHSHSHCFIQGECHKRPLLLLHATGGDESQLIPLAQRIAPANCLLGVRGNVLEAGKLRWFRRLAFGVFDMQDLIARAEALSIFLSAARAQYGLGAPVALGHSNGANIAVALLLRHPGVLAGAILLRPVVPLTPQPGLQLRDSPALIVTGANDSVIPADAGEQVECLLSAAGARVECQRVTAAHELCEEDGTIASAWYSRSFGRS